MSERGKARTALYDAEMHLRRARSACEEAIGHLHEAQEHHAADDAALLAQEIASLADETERTAEEL